jgi:membrane protease YdiL (CAAX protease family)
MLLWLIALAVAWTAAGGLLLWPRSRRWLLPPPQQQVVPWSGVEVLLAAYSNWLFWPPLCAWILSVTGVLNRLYPADPAAWLGLFSITPQDGFPSSLPWQAIYHAANKAATDLTRQHLWVSLFYFPLCFLTVPMVFRLLSGTRPEQLGLTRRRLCQDVTLGVLACTVITPIAYGILAWLSSFDMPTELHPLTQLAGQSMTFAEKSLLVFSAMVSAPVLEELFFRGVLQPWLAQRRWGGHLAMAAALLMSVIARGGRLWESSGDGSSRLHWPDLWPAIFVVAMVPGYLLIARRPGHAAIYGTSLLFAALHSGSWPHPVPLFALGLCLGCLAQRTRSLTSPIVVHALFNGYACVEMLVHW